MQAWRAGVQGHWQPECSPPAPAPTCPRVQAVYFFALVAVVQLASSKNSLTCTQRKGGDQLRFNCGRPQLGSAAAGYTMQPHNAAGWPSSSQPLDSCTLPQPRPTLTNMTSKGLRLTPSYMYSA